MSKRVIPVKEAVVTNSNGTEFVRAGHPRKIEVSAKKASTYYERVTNQKFDLFQHLPRGSSVVNSRTGQLVCTKWTGRDWSTGKPCFPALIGLWVYGNATRTNSNEILSVVKSASFLTRMKIVSAIDNGTFLVYAPDTEINNDYYHEAERIEKSQEYEESDFS